MTTDPKQQECCEKCLPHTKLGDCYNTKCECHKDCICPHFDKEPGHHVDEKPRSVDFSCLVHGIQHRDYRTIVEDTKGVSTVVREDYERDYSHVHCWESKKPPCGQCIQHLVCCLCAKLNPRVEKLEQQAYQRGQEELKEELEKNIDMLRQWLNEDRITDIKKMVTNKEIKVFFTK